MYARTNHYMVRLLEYGAWIFCKTISTLRAMLVKHSNTFEHSISCDPSEKMPTMRSLQICLQGFIVALVYCFLNEEVRSSILKSHRRWKDEKTLPSSSDHWWQRRRRSSNLTTTRREETDTETYPSSSRRNSRRVSEDTTSSSCRGSQASEITDINLNIKPKKACKPSPLANRSPPTSTKSSHENIRAINTIVFVSPVDPNKLEVCIA